MDFPDIRTELQTRPPFEFSETEQDAFAELVVDGGEVVREGLAGRIRTAACLAFMYEREILCGVGALKTPSEGYRSKIFNRAESSDLSENFSHELGWLVVTPAYRNKRLSRRLVEAILRTTDGSKIYATIRIENEPMRRTLLHFGFRPSGTHFKSERGDYLLALYLYDGP